MLLINYYDSKGKLKRILFEVAFDHWIKSAGGTSKFIKTLQAMTPMELDNIPLYFLLHFQAAFDATFPDEKDSYYQAYIYNSEFYFKQMNNLIDEHQNRIFSLPNIMFLIFLAFIILGLTSMCS